MNNKKIFDPIYGFISLNEYEFKLIKKLPFKRLQAIHQIGTASFVYTGGNHKRFDHSLGTFHIATQIFDAVVEKNLQLDKEAVTYWRKVLRVAALCHDLGHLPFSHVAEEDVLGKNGHEEWTMRIIRSDYLFDIWKLERLNVEDIVKIAVGEEIYGSTFTNWEKIVTEMLTGDYFGADRIDYLLRDSYFTGLSYGSFDYCQLIDCLRLISFQNAICLGLTEDGLESCYSLLLARYFMHKRLYQNPSVKSYSFHLNRFIKFFFKNKNYLDSIDNYISVNDYDVLSEMNKALFDKNHKGHDDAMSLMDQQKRYSVHTITQKEGDILLGELKHFNNEIFFEKCQSSQNNNTLSFPVLLKSGIVEQAEKIAEVKIPVNYKNCVYISPNASIYVKKFLQKTDQGIQELL